MAQRGERLTGYVGARRPEIEPRWLALLDAALGQPQPTSALRDAIAALRKRTRGRYYEERAVTRSDL